MLMAALIVVVNSAEHEEGCVASCGLTSTCCSNRQAHANRTFVVGTRKEWMRQRMHRGQTAGQLSPKDFFVMC
jgi:hypothetical protein